MYVYYFHFIQTINIFKIKRYNSFTQQKWMTPNAVIIKLSPHSTRYVVIAVSECAERWEVRSLWRSLGKAESPVRGWWEIRQWNHHTNIKKEGQVGKLNHTFYLKICFHCLI